MQQVILGSETYEEFLRCMSVLKEFCNDADVRNGIIRQRTNDKATVFEIDLSSIIQNMSISFTNLKQKVDLLKLFSEQEVTITENDPDDNHTNGYYTISDEFTTINFDKAELEFLDNKYIDEEERDSLFPSDDTDLILTTQLSQKISERIRIIAQSYSVNVTQVKFEGETASINVMTISGDQHAKVMSDITSERSLECISSLIITPFIIDHDGDIDFKMYNYQDDICSNISKTSIADIPINIYSRSSLIEDE